MNDARLHARIDYRSALPPDDCRGSPSGAAGRRHEVTDGHLAYAFLPDPGRTRRAITWTAAAGKLPPGVVLTGNHLGGTPTVAGTFTFTIKVTDSAGDQATEPGSITISP